MLLKMKNKARALFWMISVIAPLDLSNMRLDRGIDSIPTRSSVVGATKCPSAPPYTKSTWVADCIKKMNPPASIAHCKNSLFSLSILRVCSLVNGFESFKHVYLAEVVVDVDS